MNTENNRLIAEFMGMKPHNQNELDGFWKNTIKAHKFDNVINLQFHSDWNWLMEVVEKIESLDKRKYTLITQQNSCLLWDNDEGEELEYFNSSFKAPRKIEAVYNACVEFIKWYNLQIK